MVNGVVVSVLLLQRELEKLGHEVRVVTLAPGLRSFRKGPIYYIGSVSAGKIYPGARLRLGRSEALLEQLEAWGPTSSTPSASSALCGWPWPSLTGWTCRWFTPTTRCTRTTPTISPWGGGRESWWPPPCPGGCAAGWPAWWCPVGRLERLLRSYGVSRRIEVIPTGIDLSAYRQAPDPGEQEALRRRLGIPKGKLVLLYLGRMAREKGLETLIDHLAQADRRDAVLLLVGDGPDREEILSHARERRLPVIFAGMVPHSEVPNYYRLGDLFVTASTSETQGLTYFEALAAGLPVLCRRDPCLEGVIEDGVNGWQYGDGAEFGRRLERFCGDKDLRRRMAQAAGETAERYSAETFGRAAEALYRSVLEQEREAVGCR